jgi:hypothetical protein
MGLEVEFTPIGTQFSGWQTLSQNLSDNSYIILWVNPGPAAAIKRLHSQRFPNSVWLTNSLNSPDHEIMRMSAGSWTGMLFPSVLIPSDEINSAYRMVVEKYGVPGLHADYQTFLGFGQGQVLARALMGELGEGPPQDRGSIHRSLQRTPLAGTIVSGAKLPYGAEDLGGAYLAEVLPKGEWRPVGKEPQQDAPQQNAPQQS